MPHTIRFPFATVPTEVGQIITILNAVAALPIGGVTPYVSIFPWKTAVVAKETPYTAVVIEFTAPQPITLGDGTQPIGLFAQIANNPNENPIPTSQRAFLGILGVNLGNTFPQIPILSAEIGYSQVVCDVPAYDRIMIGGVTGEITLTEGQTVTVKARPIRNRIYGG